MDASSPEALVLSLLRGFAAATSPRDPAKALFEAGSDRFRRSVGDVDHVAHLFTNALWSPLLGHSHGRILDLDVIAGAARATIEVVPSSCEGTVRYLVTMQPTPNADGATRWSITGFTGADRLDL